MLHRQGEGNSLLDKVSVKFKCFTLTIFILLDYLPPFRTVSRIWIYLMDQGYWDVLEGKKSSCSRITQDCVP